MTPEQEARLARIDATFLDDDLREQARTIVLGIPTSIPPPEPKWAR